MHPPSVVLGSVLGLTMGMLVFTVSILLFGTAFLSSDVRQRYSPPIRRSRLEKAGQRSLPFEVIEHSGFNQQYSKKTDGVPVRICLATSVISGPTRTGGVGTAFYSLARHLAEERRIGRPVFEVTVLYAAHPYYSVGNFSYWRDKFSQWQIEFLLPPISPSLVDGAEYVKRSYTVFQYLRENQNKFDVITFPDYTTIGYFTTLAKHQQLAFQNVALVIQCHSTIRWIDELNFRPPKGHDTLGYYYMEQKSAEHADSRISPSKYFLGWMQEANYNLSSGMNFVIQNLYYPLTNYVPLKPKMLHTSHFAFFGRLEIRKGLLVFLEAVDFWLNAMPDSLKPSTVSFVGPSTKIQGQKATDIIKSHAKLNKWSCSVKIHGYFNTEDALSYLIESKAIAVLPSLGDNSPYVLVELMMKGIPFITSDAGGGPELMKDRRSVVPAGNHKALALAMANAAADGLLTSEMAVDPVQTKADYLDTLISLAAVNRIQSKEEAKSVYKEKFKVTLGLLTHHCCDVLLETVESLANQDYPHHLLHMIIVDDASDDPAMLHTLAKVSKILTTAKISHDIVVHEEKKFVSLTRNEMTRMSHSRHDDFVCFMDDDDLALPNMISTYMKVAAKTGSDIFTDIAEHYDIAANGSWTLSHTSLAVGGTFAHNFFINNYGKANFCGRSKAVHEMGGHQTGVKSLSPFVDWGFFTRASLNDLQIELVPFALYKYRKNSKGRIGEEQSGSKDLYNGHGKMIDDMKGVIPAKFHDVITLCRYSLGKPVVQGEGAL
jgi:glycosyltransferase involved in cell wall biosynthesis